MQHATDKARLILEMLLFAALAQAVWMVTSATLWPNLPMHAHWAANTLFVGSMLLIAGRWRWRQLAQRYSQKTHGDRDRWTGNMTLSLGVFLFSLTLTMLVAYQAQRENSARIAEKFERLSARVEADVKRRMALPLFGLKGAVGVHTASENLTAAEFRSYVNSIDMARQFPGVSGFGYIVPVMRQDLATFEARQRKDVSPEYTVKTAGNGSQMYVIKTIEPIESNRPALGFDEGSESVRLEGIRRAIASGTPSLTGKISLLQDVQHRPGLLYMIPVFKSETSSKGEVRKVFEGLYYAPLVLDEIMQGLAEEGDGQIDLIITDITPSQAKPVKIYEIHRNTDSLLINRRMVNMEIAGRQWQLDLHPNALFIKGLNQELPVWLGLGGTILSLALALATWLLVSGRERVERLAAKMTEELDTLAQVVKLTSNAVILSDTDHRVTWVNEGFTRLYGYTFEEAKGHRLRELVFSPNSPEENNQYLYSCIEKGIPCHTEVLNRGKDGREFWVETEVQPQRDETGEVIGYIKINQNVSELKEAKRLLEDALRETNALLKTLHGHAIVSVADRRGIIMDANDAFCAISGYARAELIGKTHAIINSGQHSRAFWTDMWRTISSGQSWKSEVCNKAKSGALYWVDSIVTPILNAEGKIEKYVSIRYDVTPRKLSEDQLRSNQAFLDRVSRTARVGGWQLDLDTQQIEWTGLSYCIPGVDPSVEIDMDAAMHMLRPKGRHQLQKAMQLAVENHAPWDIEVEAATPSGKRIWLRAVGEAEIRSGRATRLVGAFQDITERREAQLLLSETTNLLRNVLDSASGVAVVAVDPQGVINVFNAGAEQLLGYQAFEVVGSRTPLLFLDMPIDVIDDPVEGTRNRIIDRILPDTSLLGQTTECTYLRRDKSRVPVSQVITEIRSDEGELTGYLLLAQDVTERLQYEASLQAAKSVAENASAAKGQFLANMSHEIRTPMNAVLGLLRLLAKTPLTPSQKGYVSKTESAARSLLGLLNDVLDYSKIEAGKMVLDVNPFRVSRVIHDISVILESGVAEKPVSLDIHIDPEVPDMLVGDDIRLQQVLMNLGSNAVKFTPKGKVALHVNLQHREPELEQVVVRFSVEDSGIGIAPEAQQKIFEGFSQAEDSTTRRFGGTGLGLAISKKLVDMLGGQLSLRSSLGAGSRFWFDLTLGVADQSATEDPRYAGSAGGRTDASQGPRLRDMRILLVEDNATNRQVAGELLRDEGAVVHEAHNGLEGLQKVTSDPKAYDAVLMDIQMPIMDGLTAARRLRSLLGDQCPPIIAMTANVSSADRQESKSAGMVNHIGKPFDLDELVFALRGDAAPGEAVQAAPAKAAVASPSRPVDDDIIALIDVPRALSRFGGRQSVYVQMLESFLQETADTEAQANQWWQDQNITDLARWLHSMKGLTATIGHSMLSQTMALAERSAKYPPTESLDTSEPPPWLRLVHQALQQARPMIRRLIQNLKVEEAATPGAAVAATPLDRDQFQQDGQALLKLLERSDMQAMEAFAQMQRTYAPWLADKLTPLNDAIGRLDFAAALSLCQQLLAFETTE